MTAADLLRVERLSVDYRDGEGWRAVLRDVSLTIAAGEVLGLAGESGSGKSTLAALLLGETRPERRVRSGHVRFREHDLFASPRAVVQSLRGRRIGFVPQNGGAALTPTMRVGRLFFSLLRHHRPDLSAREIRARIERLLGEVGIPEPASAGRRFPHQFSGGQQQRIALALALACEPELLVLDEPTTGQDALLRQALIALLLTVRREHALAMLFVTHDLSTLLQICDRAAVMYAGDIVEIGPARDVIERPRHPYTRALVAALPGLDRPPDPRAELRGGLDWHAVSDGCRFAPRCPSATAECATQRQTLTEIAPGHAITCWRAAALDEAAAPVADRVPA